MPKAFQPPSFQSHESSFQASYCTPRARLRAQPWCEPSSRQTLRTHDPNAVSRHSVSEATNDLGVSVHDARIPAKITAFRTHSSNTHILSWFFPCLCECSRDWTASCQFRPYSFCSEAWWETARSGCAVQLLDWQLRLCVACSVWPLCSSAITFTRCMSRNTTGRTGSAARNNFLVVRFVGDCTVEDVAECLALRVFVVLGYVGGVAVARFLPMIVQNRLP
jgi:hypothetical protein